MADHNAESYEDRGVPKDEAERCLWETVNKESGGGNKTSLGRGKPDTYEASKRSGKIHSAQRSAAERSASARKAAETRKRNAENRTRH